MKEKGLIHWQSPNTAATNESGFTGIGGGRRSETGAFLQFGTYAYHWLSEPNHITDGDFFVLHSSSAHVAAAGDDQNWGCSIRCLKN